MKNVTLADIANKTGFSVNTVSHALHDKKDISAKTKEQIQAVAKEMGYIRNSSASSLRSGKTKSIAIIVGDISNPHFSIMIKEMETLFRKKGYTSFILNTDEDEEMEWTAITSAISKNVDGIILCPVQKTEGNVRYLMETGIPFTLIGRRFDQIPTNYVVCDDENGGYLAASYLLSENHRRILFLNGGAYISSAKERLLGIQRAFVEKGTPLDHLRVVTIPVVNSNQEAAIIQILKENADCTAILCFSDIIAMQVCHGLGRMHVSIPDQVSVVGFDNIASTFSFPMLLSSVTSSKNKVSEEAVKVLLEMMEGRGEVHRQIVLPTKIILRETTKFTGGS
ncbi:LacI family DNA-binding transcriptional regulator [Bianquea renquensis]|uniref:LacI family DNA-binding transcriptional regulator n=1 Tax=Bianquea renquensis TaxID=2763661 RepID=A0A926HVS2_9FIRM|nr:LacI family DNA-binding transcriptional regulator [Bianquea renquensis]MBC8541952.1 LacI family DNA-binding transcriptional regulator [Bianquea renquensis]